MSFDAFDYAVYKKLAGKGGGGVTVEPLSVTENGTYTAPEKKAYSPVTVNVPNPSTGTLNIGENGVFNVTDYASASVSVPQPSAEETLFGHKIVSGEFTPASDQINVYNVLTASQLFNAVKSEFPGAETLNSMVYNSGSEGTNNPLVRFLYALAYDADFTEGAPYAYLYGTYTTPLESIRTKYGGWIKTNYAGNMDGFSSNADAVKINATSGFSIGCTSAAKLLAGKKYRYAIFAIDHGDVV